MLLRSFFVLTPRDAVAQQKAVIEGKDLGKVEALTIEFNYLLAAQLESQRQYFEEIISTLKNEKDVEIDALKRNLESTQKEKSLLISKSERMSSDVSSLEKQKSQCQAKLTKAQEELHTLREEASFLRQVSFSHCQRFVLLFCWLVAARN